jgi:quercetin dioxygenase-like cupin family protein
VKCQPQGSGRTIHEQDYSKRIIFSREELEEEGHLLQVVMVPPKTGRHLHAHRGQTEVFCILEGEGLLYINAREFLASPGDAFICSPGDRHSLSNQSDEDFKVLVFKMNKPQEDDTDWVDG